MPAVRRLLGWAWLLLPAMLLAACGSTSSVVVGESPIPPPTDIPMVPIAVLDDAGSPVPSAQLLAGEASVPVDETGVGFIEWQGRPFNVSIEAPGFFPGAVAVSEFSNEPVPLELRPVVLRGTVTDEEGRPLTGATVHLGSQSSVSDDDGVFEISKAVPGELMVSRPGWHDGAVEWDGATLATSVSLEPRIIRGLHVAGAIMGIDEEWNELLQIADETVVNSLVIDLKNETGKVFYNSQVEMAQEVGAVQPTYDIDDVVDQLRARDLYIIGRIVAFQDPIAAQRMSDMAVWDTSTNGPYEKRGQFFLDPTDPQSRQYAIDIAEEACAAGVDEIQFDYVRYPDGFSATAVFDGGAGNDVRADHIATFLDRAGDVLHPMGCSVAADIFGFITSVSDDGGIGQQFETLSTVTDVLSPMVYPSHYSTGWFGFNTPNDNPGPVAAGALDDGMPRLQGAAVIRPWFQDFFYDSSQVRAQIDAAESRSLGWMLWNSSSNFQVGALDPAEQTPATLVTDEGDGGVTEEGAAEDDVEARSDS